MKKRKFIAAVMALSMIFGQTVYAQEYTVPEETLAESTEAVETKVSEETVENETEKTAETDVESMELETETVTEKTETMTAEYADSVMALNEGENVVEITEEGSSAKVSFTPEENGKYFIYSTGDEDTKATLYDSDMEYLTDDDDGGENTNFKLSYQFEAGKTYYICAQYYSSSKTGTINVTVEKLSNRCGDNAIWSLDEEGTLTISGEGAVTSAPWQGETIRRLVIEEGITDLDNITFQNSTELVSVQWPSTIKTIPSSCFAGCRSLKTIDIPAGVESIDDWAFQGCSSLLKAVIPSTVTYISVYDVFADCAKNFYILGYKESEAERYANENNIRFVDAANPVIPIEICDITLEQGAVEYDGTAKTPKVTVRDGDIELVEGEDYSVEYANNQDIGTASVTVTGIGNIYTGEEKLEFQIVEISDKLTVGDNYVRISIGSDSNTDMASVFFKPEEDGFYTFKMDSLGDKTIQDFRSSGVSTYTNSWDTTKVIVPVEKLYADDKYDLEVQSKIGSDTIVRITIEKRETTGEINGVSWNLSDEGVLTIDGTDLTQAAVDGIDLWRSFQSDTKKLIIGKNVTTIPYDSFEEFRVLESLELPEGLLEIGSYAFNGCQKLKNVVLPSSLKTIESGAFKRCGFKGIDVPESVESIGSSALGYDESGNLIDAFYIIGKSGSKAEAYANENNINFIDKDNPVVSINSCDVKVPKYAFYEGADVIPSVQVSFNSEKLVEGTDYTLAYENNHTVGTGTVVVTGIGKYTGSVSVNFEIKEMKTYEQTLVTGNSWLTISNEYYDSDEGEYKFDWEYSDKDQLIAESNDSSVCKVLKVYGEKPKYGDEEEQNVCLKIQSIQSGDAVITVKDTDGSTLFKCNITVKQLPDDAVVFEDEALQGQLIEDYDKNGDGYLSTKEVENIRRISISGSYHGEQVKSLAGLEQAANATSFSLSEGSSVTDITVLGQLKQLENLDIRDINIDNLEGISNCTNLEQLYLDGCQVGSWEGIEKLTNLEKLSLRRTNFSNAKLLSGMQKLEKLSLDETKNLTNIKPLAVLEKLNSLTLSESGVSDQDKWDFANIQDLTVVPGDKFQIPRYANLLLDLNTTISEGEECISDSDWGSYTALKQGTVKMHLVYKEKFSTDITITINAGEDQTVGSDYQNKVEVKSADNFDVSQILDSNGDLWTTTPELKKTHTGVKQYVADYVYEKNGSNGAVKKFMGYYLDADNTLWSEDDKKIAENIVKAAGGGALDSDGNFYDLHSDNPQPISNVEKWAAGSSFTYLLKTDGSLWRRSMWDEDESFKQICDKVLDIVKWAYHTGAYIQSDGTVVKETFYPSGGSYSDAYKVEAASFGTSSYSYYDKNGDLRLLSYDYNFGKINAEDIERFRVDDTAYYLILNENSELYLFNTDNSESEQIDSNVEVLNHSVYDHAGQDWQYKKENKCYKVSDSLTVEEVLPAVITQVGNDYWLYNEYDDHEGALVRYDTVFLDHVTTIWADYVTINWTDKNKVYALRTDGSVWDVTNAPVKMGTLNESKDPEPEPEKVSYKLENGVLTISGKGAMDSYDKASAQPWYKERAQITSVVVEDGITEIGSFAFYGLTNLNSVSIADSVTEVGGYAFKNCTALTDVQLPEKLESIGESAFYGCSGLSEISFQVSLKSIGGYAFSRCTGIKQITFAGDAPEIQTGAFSGVKASVEYPKDNASWTADKKQNYGGQLTWDQPQPWEIKEHVLMINDDSVMKNYDSASKTPWYANREDITSIVVADGVTKIGTFAFYGFSNLTSVQLSDSVTSIGGYAFKNCKKLTEIVIPSAVTKIGESAFYDCGITEIVIPSKVAQIGDYAFSRDTKLKKISFEGDAPSIGAHTFYGVTAAVTYPADNNTWNDAAKKQYGGTLTWNNKTDDNKQQCGKKAYWEVKDGVLTISGEGAVDDYDSAKQRPWNESVAEITKVVVEDGITTVGNFAFYGMVNLAEVELADSVIVMGAYSFKNCSNIEQITLPQNLTEIKDSAFYGCTRLANITIPAKVTKIGDYVFSRNVQLNQVKFEGSAPTIAAHAFSGVVAVVTYPSDDVSWTSDMKKNYGGTLDWKESGEKQQCGKTAYWEVKDGTLTISGSGAVDNYDSAKQRPWNESSLEINKVVVEDGITSVGDFAFYGMTNLAEIVLTDSVTSIGTYAFKNCSSLKEIILPKELTEIKDSAFYGCAKLTSIAIPEKVKKIGDYAFSRCTALKVISFKGDAPEIAQYAFNKVTADVSYTAGNTTWTDENKINYGGKLTWSEEQ